MSDLPEDQFTAPALEALYDLVRAMEGRIDTLEAAPPPEGGPSAVALGLFGDGSDGDVVIGAGTTTLTRDMFYDDLTIDAAGILKPNGFRVFVRGVLTLNGKIQYNGNNAAGAVAGAAGNSSAWIGAGRAGAAGGVNAGANAAGSSGSVGGAGGNGGAGGTGAAGTGASTAPNAARLSTLGTFVTDEWLYNNFDGSNPEGGQGGGGGGGDGTNSGGGGGGGGGVMRIAVASVVWGVAGSIEAKGGAGAAGVAGNAGGGGGGGGGWIAYIFGEESGARNLTVAGGTAGAGVGTGVAGVAGAAGRTSVAAVA